MQPAGPRGARVRADRQGDHQRPAVGGPQLRVLGDGPVRMQDDRHGAVARRRPPRRPAGCSPGGTAVPRASRTGSAGTSGRRHRRTARAAGRAAALRPSTGAAARARRSHMSIGVPPSGTSMSTCAAPPQGWSTLMVYAPAASSVAAPVVVSSTTSVPDSVRPRMVMPRALAPAMRTVTGRVASDARDGAGADPMAWSTVAGRSGSAPARPRRAPRSAAPRPPRPARRPRSPAPSGTARTARCGRPCPPARATPG